MKIKTELETKLLEAFHEYDYVLFNPALVKREYQYEVLTGEYIDRVVTMFTKSFCDSEPMTKHINMQYHEFTPFARQVVEKAAKDGLSIIALDGERVVACALVEDLADPVQFNVKLTSKFDYIFSLLDRLGHRFFSEKEFGKNQVAHLFITAVDEEYRGQGLSRQVNFRAMDRAANMGFNFMNSELTHLYNEKGTMKHLKKHKQLLIGSCIYEDFFINGRQPFRNLVGSANAYIWELRMGAKLIYKTKKDNKKHTKSLRSLSFLK